MRKIMQRLTGRQIVFLLTGLLSFVLGLVLSGIGNFMAGSLDTQNMAARWSKEGGVSQISCFFSREAGIEENSILSFEHNLDKALEEASIVSESENENARLWADAYSATGKVSITSDRSSVEVAAVGIGGDFFLFHPLKLVSGSYFSGNDVMKDYIVIDEDAAWQLFGSNDVAGQMVTISGIPHIISGVIEREQGRLNEAAGLSSSVAYVSYETLSRYGTNYGLNTYEIVMPNPVTGYAKNYVAENIGVTENEVEIVENSTRYSLMARFKLLAQFGTRSMSSKAIIYPYWENVARGYEDILGLFLVFMVLLYIYPAVLLIVAIVRAWKHKTWTAKSVWMKVQDRFDRLREKRWMAQKRKKAERENTSEKVKKTKRDRKPKREVSNMETGREEDNYEEVE
ncbi:MAG: ABC transporter permease [Lachnospiraceae bacterium]